MEETEKTSGNNMNNIHLYLSKRHRLFYGYSLLDLYQNESHFIPSASAYSRGLVVHRAFVLFCATYKLIDNASAHTARELIMPDNIVLLPLPPYCPELNPIERLWQYIKSKIDFTLHKTLEALKQNVADILKEKCTDPVVASITGYSYIVDAVVALMHS
jgi:hypothetical protein